MDIQQFILSGIIEAYVLGLASVDEMREVEKLSAEHPEIKKAIIQFEEALEKQAMANAIAPPAMLKQRVMQALADAGMKADAPVIPIPVDNAAPSSKVISITAAPKSIRWLRGAIAASIILLLGSAILNFYFYSQYKKYSNQYSSLLAQNTTLTAKNDVLQTSYDMLKDTSMKQVQMTAASPQMSGFVATVLWDMKSKDVWVMVNNLPKPPAGNQYQLWALVNGQPVDAGVFDTDGDGLIRMKNIPNAQAFAVTLEKRGGSPTPNMKQLHVLGKVS